jgi:hypothetical protein
MSLRDLLYAKVGNFNFLSLNQQQEAINTNCINHTQDWTLENTHSHKELLKYGTI